MIPVLGQNDLLPVPLVDVDAVHVVQLVLVAAYGVHVRVDALARVEVVALEREALPLGEGLHHLAVHAGVRDLESRRGARSR